MHGIMTNIMNNALCRLLGGLLTGNIDTSPGRTCFHMSESIRHS